MPEDPHLCRPSVSRRRVPLFHASACDELTPPLHRAPPRPHAGRSLAEGTPTRRAFVPGLSPCPSFDAITNPYDASAVVQPRSSSRRTPDPLVASLFHSRFPPRLLTDMTLRWFGLSACTANPEDLPPSLAQHGLCRRPSTSSSHSFQGTRSPGFPGTSGIATSLTAGSTGLKKLASRTVHVKRTTRTAV